MTDDTTALGVECGWELGPEEGLGDNICDLCYYDSLDEYEDDDD